MIQPSDDRRPPITPQLALRVAILGGVALALFAIVFFRLWFLQVLSGDQYLAQARDNRVRDVAIAAPRGEILDRNGNVLVENRAGDRGRPVSTAEAAAAERDAARHLAPAMTARSQPPKCSRRADASPQAARELGALRQPSARARRVGVPGRRRVVQRSRAAVRRT